MRFEASTSTSIVVTRLTLFDHRGHGINSLNESSGSSRLLETEKLMKKTDDCSVLRTKQPGLLVD